MEYADIPSRITTIWASGVGSPYVNTIPQTPSGDPGRAAFSTGFPALNFQSISSGGVPPFGGDFNGLEQLLTQQMQWIQAGMPPIFNAAFQTAIGGYPVGAVVQSAATVATYWQSQVDNNMTDPDAAGAGWATWPINPPLLVPMGGTGQPSFTEGAIILGNGTDALAEIDVLNVARGGTGKDSFPLGAILLGNGINPITEIDVLNVPRGGTGATTLTANAVLIGAGASAIVGVSPSGTLPLVSTGGAPAFAALNLNTNASGGTAVNLTGVLPAGNAPVMILAIYPTPGVYTFNVPADRYWVWGQCVGAGGGGAGHNSGTDYSGGGGGAGGYGEGWIPVIPGQAITITIGTGGTFGPAGGTATDGGNGGSSSIGAFISGTGGNGGQSTANAAGGNPGTGNAAAVSGFANNGGYGLDGTVDPGGSQWFAGGGGSSYFGGGVRQGQTVPATPAAFGAGGGGGYGASGGSAGMPGCVIIRG